jgi:hypothetical protein
MIPVEISIPMAERETNAATINAIAMVIQICFLALASWLALDAKKVCVPDVCSEGA